MGPIAEGLAISPDGRHVAVTVMNGSNAARTSPFFNDFGWLRIYALNKTALALVAETQIGHWCQGVAWSADSRTVLAQCAVEREIRTFGFDGRRLVRRRADQGQRRAVGDSDGAEVAGSALSCSAVQLRTSRSWSLD